MKRGCRYAACTGNRISWNAAANRFSLTVIHDKGERLSRGKAYQLLLPTELTTPLYEHLVWGRTALLTHHQASNHAYLLVDHEHAGVPYTPATLNKAWVALMRKLGA